MGDGSSSESEAELPMRKSLEIPAGAHTGNRPTGGAGSSGQAGAAPARPTGGGPNVTVPPPAHAPKKEGGCCVIQ
eukprot:CAMPEP_0184692342 /NCGR_PEP_ID=MMETSP0313-20130426/864_1 /TAXON_ID=2792 /ORGANISM="Porphyridium aerugineum, Strain SAG 1380-2" /LENGTH=74 /DNA_ID=CAMNT_0027150167 /DNA_START=205 /DNA_END=429 /DNA_ORIENTATION=+